MAVLTLSPEQFTIYETYRDLFASDIAGGKTYNDVRAEILQAVDTFSDDGAMIQVLRHCYAFVNASERREKDQHFSEVAPIVHTIVAPSSTVTVIPTTGIVPGYYTVSMAGGTYKTFRIKPHWDESDTTGTLVACYLAGPDNSNDYVPFAFVKGNNVFVWRRFKTETLQVVALTALVQGDYTDSGALYAQRSNNCWRCNRHLTVPASLHRGLGPECARIIGC